MDFKNKNILVTGGSGMVGQALVPMLLERGANVTIATLDDVDLVPLGIDEFYKVDLTNEDNCLDVCHYKDIVFNLIGIKTSPKIMQERPAEVFEKYLKFTNMIIAGFEMNVKWFLYTSSIGVYNFKVNAASSMYLIDGNIEKNMWDANPSKNDWYGGWGKRIGEMLLQAYKEQDNWNKFSIVRPANVFGPFDNFNPETSMVIPSLISRMINGENPLKVWGDGTQIRDFISSEDVAKGMIYAVENEINEPVNLGSGIGTSIKDLVYMIRDHINKDIEIEWDTTQPSGDKRRLLNMRVADELGFPQRHPLKQSLQKTIDWYIENKNLSDKRFDVFD